MLANSNSVKYTKTMIRKFLAYTFCLLSFAIVFSQENSLSLIHDDGNTIPERISTPYTYKRIAAEQKSFAEYLRNFPLKKAGSPVLLYNGHEKPNQSAHAAVFALPIENQDLQQSAQVIMRLYAEYFYHTAQEEKIKFLFENKTLCKWTDWKRDFRIDVAGSLKKWTRFEQPPDKNKAFLDYLRNVFSYTNTFSMQSYESKPISFSELQIGDILMDAGSPGHVCMVVDIAESKKEGQRVFLLAQGFRPAQDFYILKNPNRINDPWYHEEDFRFPLRTNEYIFPRENWRRLTYLSN